MPRKWDGINAKIKNWDNYIALMAKVNKGEEVKGFKPKKMRPYRPRGPHKSPENALQRDIVDFLRISGAYTGRVEVRGLQRFGRWTKDRSLLLGIPDIIVFANGKMTFIECKIGNAVLSDAQVLFRDQCLLCGINHVIARSVSDVMGLVT